MRVSIILVSTIAFALATSAWAQTSKPAVPVDTTTPKGTLKSLAVAMDAGDANAIRSLLQTTSPSEEKMVGAMSELAAEISAMNRAVISKFGREQGIAALGGDPAQMLKESLLTIDSATEKVDGDSATVSTPAQETMTLKKVNGAWKVSVTDLSKGSTPQAVDERVAILSAQMKAMREVTAAIAADKYSTATEAVAALRTKLGGPPPPTTAASAPAK